ncbi:hypothetical protein GQ472_05865 [archaeon]|nr:hypothetical protein [archaeon]
MITKNIKKLMKEYFFLHPTVQLRVRHIERDVGVPLPSAIRYVKELEEEEVLKSSFVSGVKLFSADRTSGQFLAEKRMYNIMALSDSGLLKYLVETLDNPTIVLFGSYSRGEDVEDSDIDLYVEVQGRNLSGLKKFEKGLGRKIQIFFYRTIDSVENKELANNIINGVTLNGFLEVIR